MNMRPSHLWRQQPTVNIANCWESRMTQLHVDLHAIM